MEKKDFLIQITELRKRNINEATRMVEEALAKFPNDIEILFLQADIHEAMSETTKAINIYFQILDLDKNNKEAKIRQSYQFTIQQYKNSNIYASTNLGHDPWFDE